MTIKPEPTALTVWRIMLSIACAAAEFAAALLLMSNKLALAAATSIISVFFLYMYMVYYPIKLKRLAAQLKNNRILITTGVINKNIYIMEYDKIQFINIITSPMQRIFGICTVFVKAAGGTVYISGISKSNAEYLKEAVFPNERS